MKYTHIEIRKVITFLFIMLITFSSIQAMENPFYKNYKTQFEIPPFSEIEEKHFMPAYFKGMEEHNNEIEQIIQNTEKPSFENVIIAMERSGELLDKVNAVFFNLSGSATNEKLQEIEKEISPKLSQHYDSISLNPYIFKKVSFGLPNFGFANPKLQPQRPPRGI